MFNDIHLGPLTLHMYGIMIAIGFMAALLISIYRAKKRGLSEDIIYGIFYCAVLGGLVGSRGLYYIVEIPNIIKDPSILWNFKEGYVVYGGLIAGVLFSYIYIQVMKKQVFLDYFDLVVPALAIAQGFGRLGCFFAGCCYGAETDSWFHIVFHNSVYAPNNVPLIPTQLISSAGDFIFGGILMFYASRKPLKGRVGAAYLLLYGVGRFIIEFFRADYRGSIGVLSTSQLISIFIVALAAILYLLAPKFKVNNEQVNNE